MKSLPILINQWETDNKIPVFFVQRNEVPILEIRLIFKAGSCYDGNNPGISNMTNTMLNKGTKTYSQDKLAISFEEAGAEFQATSDRDMSIVSLRTLTNPLYLHQSLTLFSEIISQPVFPIKPFNYLQKLIQNAIIYQGEMPELLAKNAFFSLLYKDHPYARSILGTPTSISTLTIEKLKNFYKQYYVAKRASLTIVGDLSLKKAKEIANYLVSHLPMGTAAEQIPKAYATAETVREIIPFPSTQTHVLMGQVGINYCDSHYFPIFLGSYILGEAPFNSRLFQKIRNTHGLVYSIGSNLTPLVANGPFSIIFQTRNEEVQKAIAMVEEALFDFTVNGSKKSERSKAKNEIINGFPFSIALNSQIATHLQNIAFYNLPLDYLNNYCEKIAHVNEKQIEESLQDYLLLKNQKIIMVGQI